MAIGSDVRVREGRPRVRPGRPRPARRDTVLAVARRGPELDAAFAFAGVAVLVYAAVGFSPALLAPVHTNHAFGSTGVAVLDGWMHWDAGWYANVARHGYGYRTGGQSSVAFFPLYPFLMRSVALATRDVLVAGVAVTLASGLGSVALFAHWLDGRVETRARALAVSLLLVFPYAYFLYGAVYSDALFLACALGAFVLLEDGRPWAAGVVGALATAARPIGPFLVVGLFARTIELHRQRGEGSAVRAVLPVGTSALGLVAYATYLGARFGDPLAFAHTQTAWGHGWSIATLAKIPLVRDLAHASYPYALVRYAAAPAVTLAALVAIPFVFRRFGVAYGLYALGVVAFPALVTDDLFSMGRFLLAAFPCFAVGGVALARCNRTAGAAVVVASATGLLVVSAMLARGYYLA